MSDHYQYWRLALKSDAPSLSPAEADAVKCGFWRTKRGFIGAWPSRVDDSGCHVPGSGYTVQTERGVKQHDTLPDMHGFAFATPVSYDDYMYRYKNGMWPGEIAKPGHNSAATSEYDSIRDNINETVKEAERWLLSHPAIVTQEECDKAANYRDLINRLTKSADEAHKAERTPLAEAVTECNKKWTKLTEVAKATAKRLMDGVSLYMVGEKNKRERAAEEERKRIEAERKELERTDITLAALSPAPEVKAKKVVSGGQFGKKVSLRTITTAVIKDYDKALAYFARHDSIVGEINRLCNAAARSKVKPEIPGVEYVEHEKAV